MLAGAIITRRTKNCFLGSELSGVDEQAAIFETELQEFPTNGASYLVLSSGTAVTTAGNATTFQSVNTNGVFIPGGDPQGSPDGLNSFDVVTLSLTFKVPENPGNILFDWKFMTEENPSFINTFTDYFRADLATSQGIFNIALLPDNSPVTVANAAPFSNAPGGSSEFPAPPFPDPDDVVFNAVSTPIMTASFDLSPFAGEIITLSLRVADVNDSVYDSAVLIDNLRIEGCLPRKDTCVNISTEDILCDEIFHVEDEESIEIGEIRILADSLISGDTMVTALDCQTIVDNTGIKGIVDFLIEKELLIETQDSLIPLEFGFRLRRELQFKKCDFNLLPDELACQVLIVFGKDKLILNPSTINSDTGELNKDANIEDDLNLGIKLILSEKKQSFVSNCSGDNQVKVSIIS